jgi:hypothetical protein
LRQEVNAVIERFAALVVDVCPDNEVSPQAVAATTRQVRMRRFRII